MSRATVLVIVLVFTGMAVFGWGVRVADAGVRWAAIGFFFVALLVRLVSTGSARRD